MVGKVSSDVPIFPTSEEPVGAHLHQATTHIKHGEAATVVKIILRFYISSLMQLRRLVVVQRDCLNLLKRTHVVEAPVRRNALLRLFRF